MKSRFALSVKNAIGEVKEDARNKVNGMLFDISSRIIMATPVGNPELWIRPAEPGYVGGTLRASWNASIGQPDTARTTKTDQSGGQTINKMSATLKNFDLGQTFYLTNPQPYAVRVEYGWSKQAPKGMVRVAIASVAGK